MSSAAEEIRVPRPKTDEEGGCSAPPPIDLVSIPHDIEKRGVTTGGDREPNRPVDGPLRAPMQVTEPAGLNLSRWRHGFEPRWATFGHQQPGHPPRHPPPSARGRTAAGAFGNGRTARHTSPVPSPRKRERGFPGRRWLSQDPADLLIPGAGDYDRVEVHLARAMMNA
jgi:hypothetical protein